MVKLYLASSWSTRLAILSVWLRLRHDCMRLPSPHRKVSSLLMLGEVNKAYVLRISHSLTVKCLMVEVHLISKLWTQTYQCKMTSINKVVLKWKKIAVHKSPVRMAPLLTIILWLTTWRSVGTVISKTQLNSLRSIRKRDSSTMRSM